MISPGPQPMQPRSAAVADSSARANRRRRPQYLLLFYVIFAFPLFMTHLGLLSLPYFWDELGQFVPTALDILRHGWLVPRSTVPNVHPPALAAYLAVAFAIGGNQLAVARSAMLLLAAGGLVILFLLSIQLSRGTKGVPAFLPPLFLLASPLFFTQSMMAQLDMPAMVFTLLVLLLFIRGSLFAAALLCIPLVLVKETGMVVPMVFAFQLLRRGRWQAASWFAMPLPFLAAWLVLLHAKTGHWLGDPGFAHYNITYALHPVRMAFSLVRRLFYVFIAEGRFIGTAVLILALKQYRWLFTARQEWQTTLLVCAALLGVVTVFGGAELERYVLPVLPIFYIAVSVALTFQSKRVNAVAIPSLLAALVVSIWFNPPYPFPFENNLAMVDFVRLQQVAALFAERSLKERRIATAWPYTAALRNPDFHYVDAPLHVVETKDFRLQSIKTAQQANFDALIVYTRTWLGRHTLLRFGLVRAFLAEFYDWEPQVTADDCAALGLREVVSWESRGQVISVYVRDSQPPSSNSIRASIERRP